MKITRAILKDRIVDIGTACLTSPPFDLSYDAGMLTASRPDKPDEAPYLIPLGSVGHMRPEPKPKKAT